MTPADFQRALDALQKQGVLPRALSAQSRAAIARSLDQYAEFAASTKRQEILDKIRAALESTVNPQQVLREGATQTVTEGFNQASARGAILQVLDSLGAAKIADTANLDFMIRTATGVMRGAGQFIQQNNDPEALDAFPALEFFRLYDVEIPRGLRRGPAGALMPAPEEAWDTPDGRWLAAAAESGDTDAADLLQRAGRMVALKSSGIWAALGDGAGGYDDALGNPFPPFAFNSGYSTEEVSRVEAVELGLMDPSDTVKPNSFDLAKLFATA